MVQQVINKKKTTHNKNFPSSPLGFMFSFTDSGGWYQSQVKQKAINIGTS